MQLLQREQIGLDRIENMIGTSERTAMADALQSEYFSEELTGKNQSTLRAALTSLADDEQQIAIDTLQNRFESVCETTPPTVEPEPGWHVACHHYNDMDSADEKQTPLQHTDD